MVRFVFRRAAQALFALVVTTFLIYYGLLVYRDPFVSNGGRLVPEHIQAALRAKFGMDEPFLVRYLVFLRNLATGDLGTDFEQRRPVADLLAAAVPNTARLVLIAVAFQVTVGIALGVIAAYRRGSRIDWIISVGTMALFALPSFVLAVFLRAKLNGLTIGGFEVLPAIPHRYVVEYSWLQEALLPGVCIGLAGLGMVIRVTRGSMMEALTADYLITARAKGLPERRVVGRHALRNALIPVVTMLGVELGALLGGSFIIESIFDFPGVGNLFLRALRTNNDPVIVAVTVYSLAAFIVLAALVDVLYARLDPRIRLN